MPIKPSLRSRMLEWILWRIRVKKMFQNTDGMREKILKGRPKNPAPPRSVYRKCRVEESIVEGNRVFTLWPRHGSPNRHALYLHGGAFVYEIMSMQWTLAQKFVTETNTALTVPLYPLAPEKNVHDALACATAAYEAVLLKAAGKPLLMIGDSAGCGMVLSLCQILRDSGSRLPDKNLLFSPWLDVTCSDPRQDELDRIDPILSRPGLQLDGQWYADSLDLRDPRVSPLFGSMDGLPPMFILTGTHDLLHADSIRLRQIIPDTQLLKVSVYSNMLHVWPTLPLPEAKAALVEAFAFVRSAP